MDTIPTNRFRPSTSGHCLTFNNAGHAARMALFSAATVAVILLAGRVALAAGLYVSTAVAVSPGPTRSTNVALTSDDRRLVVVNRDTNSISVMAVRNALG